MSDDYTHFKSFPKISGFMNYKCFVCGLSLRNNQPENGYDKPDRINASHHVPTDCVWNLNPSIPLEFILCSALFCWFVCLWFSRQIPFSISELHTYLTSKRNCIPKVLTSYVSVPTSRFKLHISAVILILPGRGCCIFELSDSVSHIRTNTVVIGFE